ncbi:hypothetical protein NDU88_005620 [Pleurodeles waltl]|uniref:Uncharacterized protein n=1 Tax=Pleurodeles waltl TaxID=8319 RepID=A0AAV7NMW6_PLEWA|nr:hypothetical protein NDU88_005620 [Pleurodeles waltl]
MLHRGIAENMWDLSAVALGERFREAQGGVSGPRDSAVQHCWPGAVRTQNGGLTQLATTATEEGPATESIPVSVPGYQLHGRETGDRRRDVVVRRQRVDPLANVSAAESGTRSNLGLDDRDMPGDREGCGLRGRGPADWRAAGDGAVSGPKDGLHSEGDGHPSPWR